MRIDLGILNPRSTRALSMEQAHWIGSSFSWSWRGENEDGIVMAPGTYLRWTDLESGDNGQDRCLIALAPPSY